MHWSGDSDEEGDLLAGIMSPPNEYSSPDEALSFVSPQQTATIQVIPPPPPPPAFLSAHSLALPGSGFGWQQTWVKDAEWAACQLLGGGGAAACIRMCQCYCTNPAPALTLTASDAASASMLHCSVTLRDQTHRLPCVRLQSAFCS